MLLNKCKSFNLEAVETTRNLGIFTSEGPHIAHAQNRIDLISNLL
jgi:hypothetical protein